MCGLPETCFEYFGWDISDRNCTLSNSRHKTSRGCWKAALRKSRRSAALQRWPGGCSSGFLTARRAPGEALRLAVLSVEPWSWQHAPTDCRLLCCLKLRRCVSKMLQSQGACLFVSNAVFEGHLPCM